MTVQEYELTKIQISDLKFDDSNPNQLTKEQEQALKKAMKRFGYLVPIVINENYEIGDGEHRARLYKEMGLTEIPAYIVPKINDDIERRLLRQTMNKLRGEHEIKMDADEIALIFQNNKLNDLSELLAQQRNELEDILTKHKGIQFQREDNFDVDKELEDLVPVTELGDIWQLGNHRIICADCSDERSIDRLIEDNKIKLVLTDPPYGINIVQIEGSSNGGSKPNTIGRLGPSNIVEANYYRPIQNDDKDFDPKPLLNLGENQIIFGANYFADKLPISSGWLVWYKRHDDWDNKNITFAECELMWSSFHIPARFYSVTWMGLIKEGEHGKRLHPTQKPIKLLSSIIMDFTEENDNILDPYIGSGSTLIACEQTNRICYGVEIDPRYIDIIIKRYQGLTGKEAIRLKDNKTYNELKLSE